MSNYIHSTSILEGNVKLGNNVKVGPFCYLTGNITLEDNVELKSHVCLSGDVQVGAETVIYPFSSIGNPPQDEKFKGELSSVIIGKGVVIREYVTISGGSDVGNHFKNTKNVTQIGDFCYLMINSHVGHNCCLENSVTLTNNVAIAGHCLLEERCIIGGASSLHQFTRIGKYAMIGGMCAIGESVPPYGIVFRDSDKLSGLNLVGLKRCGFDSTDISLIKKVYNKIFKENSIDLTCLRDEEHKDFEIFQNILTFFENVGKRGVLKASERVLEKGF